VKGLALVLKTKNAIIAGFYPEALKDNEILDKGGLLVSVTNDKSYRTKRPEEIKNGRLKAMIYDPFFFIYGNT